MKIAAALTTASLVAVTGCSSPAPEASTDTGNAGVVARIVTVGSPGTSYGFVSDKVRETVAKTGATAEATGYFPATEPALEALNAGAADIAEVATSGALSGLAGRGDYIFLGVNTKAPGTNTTIVVPNDSPVRTFEDLVGRSVAVTRGGAGEYIVDMALANRGLSADKINKVFLGPGDAAAAFTNGSVDAWAAFSTFIPSALERMNARTIVKREELDGKYDYGVLVVRREFAQQHPTVAKAVLDGYAAASDETRADPTAWLEKQRSTNGFSPSQLKYLEENLGRYEPYDAETTADLQSSIDAWVKIGTLQRPLVASEIIFDYDAAGD
ncbi:ABC transporter substrate-binding protein [Pseudonocardia sp.]|jgi:sulfonate transport system substrate-binding protein|uniref:ABC transporter substrate-binding protein n=1 Tax=Pseudonocardia sp. TaxID=60912 RepID=UPI003D11CB92